MAKFHGNIGFGITVETKPGVWDAQVTEKDYSGDIVRFSKNYQASENINDNISISNQISIIGDLFAIENSSSMLYVEYMNAKWKISSIDASSPPRLVLNLGGLYNEQHDIQRS